MTGPTPYTYDCICLRSDTCACGHPQASHAATRCFQPYCRCDGFHDDGDLLDHPVWRTICSNADCDGDGPGTCSISDCVCHVWNYWHCGHCDYPATLVWVAEL